MKLSERMLYPTCVAVSFEIEPNSGVEKITHPNEWYEARVAEVAQLEAEVTSLKKEQELLQRRNEALREAMSFARECEDEHGRIDWDIVDALLTG